MVLSVIMSFTIFIMWISLAFSYGRLSTENSTYLLGISLPDHYRGDPEVMEIVEEYRKGYRRITYLGLLGGAVQAFFFDYLSLTILLLMVWYILLFYCYRRNVMHNARRLYRIKQKNGWLGANSHIVRVDTVLSSIGGKGAVSPLWFLPAAGIIGAGCYLALRYRGNEGIGLTALMLPAFAMFVLVYVGIRRSKLKVYCANSEANRRINETVRREWSRCFVLHAYGLALMSLYVSLPSGISLPWLTRGQGNGIAAMLLSFLCGIISVVLIVFAHRRIKKVKDMIFESIKAAGEELYGDDDEYWLNGIVNRQNGHKLVEKRIGIGMSTGDTMSGGTTEMLLLLVSTVFVAALALYLLPFDFADISMKLDGGRCRIQGASMGVTIDLEEVTQVTLLDSLPSMSKRNGFDSNRYNLGDFRVEGCGESKVYVFLKNENIIRVDTGEMTIFFNGEDKEETMRYYRELTDWMEGLSISCGIFAFPTAPSIKILINQIRW